MNRIFQERKIEEYFKYIPYLVFLIIFIFIWKLNSLTPLWADDYCRFANHTSIFHAIEKSYIRYFERSGRFFVYIIDYFVFGNYPIAISYFNFINATFFTLLIFLIFVVAFGRKPKNLRDGFYILLIFDLVFVGVRGIGEVALWKSGSVGYLWAVTLELAILLPFFLFLRGKKSPFSNKYWIYGFYLISFIAATFLEHLSFAITLVMIYILIERKVRNKFIPNFLQISALLHFIGSLSLFISKGNIIQSSIQRVPPLTEIILNNLSFLQPITQGALGWIFVTFLVLALTSPKFVSNLKNSLIWPIFALASMIFLTFTILPTEQQFIFRIAFPFEIFLILAITYLAGYIPKITIFEVTSFLILLIIALGHGATAYKNSNYINEQVKQREDFVKNMKDRGEVSIKLNKILLPNVPDPDNPEYIYKYNYISDISKDPKHWINSCFANAVGIKEVVLR